MKIRLAILTVLLLGSLAAQTTTSPASSPTPAPSPTEKNATDELAAKPSGIKESDRLMQEYMAQRAKWIALRSEAKKQVATAKTSAERNSILQKLATDERVLRSAADEARQRYRAAIMPQRAVPAEEKPRETR